MLFTASHFQTGCHHGTVYSISLSNPKGRQYPPDRCLMFLAPTPKMLADWHQAKVSGADMDVAWERYTNDRADLPDDYCPDVRLTKNQQATLDFWLRYKLAKGSVPTIKETQAATGHSKAAIYGHLKKLRRLGLLPAYEGSVPTAAAIAKVRQEVSRGLAEGWLHLSPHHQEVFGDVLELLEDGA